MLVKQTVALCCHRHLHLCRIFGLQQDATSIYGDFQHNTLILICCSNAAVRNSSRLQAGIVCMYAKAYHPFLEQHKLGPALAGPTVIPDAVKI